MTEQHIIHNRGTIVARPDTTLLFIESPEHYYAVGNAEKMRLQIGDEVEFEAIYGDQFANVTKIEGRRRP